MVAPIRAMSHEGINVDPEQLEALFAFAEASRHEEKAPPQPAPHQAGSNHRPLTPAPYTAHDHGNFHQTFPRNGVIEETAVLGLPVATPLRWRTHSGRQVGEPSSYNLYSHLPSKTPTMNHIILPHEPRTSFSHSGGHLEPPRPL